ncbi:PREDICTED: KH domain-containing protein HEN4-like [Nelumbo nucifera]|uniref:KH domain-containing protein HEN4-like n=1 Tax=Nelumbo nucifera TaxID=4432 RepID=A0A1U8Q631_NELNU|nr:PREDICTED: KH domain-containing protein HEN4-like [Nelumbo nucifera]
MDKSKAGSFKKRPHAQFKKKKGYKKSQRQNFNQSFNYDQNAGNPGSADTVYRILCPSRKIGSVIGTGGSIINALRDETRAKIRVAESVPGTDERVIMIFSSATRKPRRYNTSEDTEDDGVLTEKEHELMQPHCPAQDALLKVHERIAEEDELFGGATFEDNNENDVVTARLLVPNNQVGCLLEHLPACAMNTDELVQISGTSAVAKRALYEVSTLLYQNPRKDIPTSYPKSGGGSGFYPPGGPMLPQGNSMWSHHGAHGTPPMPWGGGYGNQSGFMQGSFGNAGETSDEFSLKILCLSSKIGGVIGKGGSNVKQLQKETGANIQVDDTFPDVDERAIVVSSFEGLWNPRSPTIEAILQLQGKTSEMSENGIITTRLLVPSSKVGCLLGQGGNVITEMRRRTQADIRIISKDGRPKCASADEELVQISGNYSVARDALSEIASRLRVRTLRGSNAAVEPPPPPPPPSMGPFQGFGPSGNFPVRGPPGPPPSSIIGAGSSGGYDHMKGAGGEYEAPNYQAQPAPTGYPNVDNPMEVKIPNNAVGSVLGAGGSNISNIHEISGARVKLQDPLAGGSECVVEIHGSSEKMNAAQNFLQAFISSAVCYQANCGQINTHSDGKYCRNWHAVKIITVQ